MWCVVGLGNPGSRYQGTRHNLGFMVVDSLARMNGASWSHRSLYESARTRQDNPIILLKPTTYMNLSGSAVARALRYHIAARESLLVVCDDVNLPFGSLRLRARGSPGGHRGLESIIQALGTEEFPRLRMGIGRPGGLVQTPAHVLSAFSPAERASLADFVDRAAAAVMATVERGIEKAMNDINRTIKEEPR